MTSIEFVTYLTIHVAQEMELDPAERTGIRLVTAVGEEAGRVAAEGQDKSTAASQLQPKYCVIIPKPLFRRSSFFQPKNLRVFPGILLLLSFCFFNLLLLLLL